MIKAIPWLDGFTRYKIYVYDINYSIQMERKSIKMNLTADGHISKEERSAKFTTDVYYRKSTLQDIRVRYKLFYSPQLLVLAFYYLSVCVTIYR